MPSCGLSSGAYDGNWNAVSHSSFSTKNSASSSTRWTLRFVPDPDHGGLELVVRYDDQVAVVLPGEALRLALASPVHVQPVDQTRSFAALVADQSRNGNPSPVRATHPHLRCLSARRPRMSLRRPRSLPGLVLEADVGVPGRRGGFTVSHTSLRHRSTLASSRSSARRAGTCGDQPCRRISFHTPCTVYSTRNSRMTRARIRTSVQPCSSSHPCASIPPPNSRTRHSHCAGPNSSTPIGPRYVFRGPARGPLASGPGMAVPPCRRDDLGGGATGPERRRWRR
ncbi:hypothetical protein ABIE67_009906 [Streptomyces sp. V4I8]